MVKAWVQAYRDRAVNERRVLEAGGVFPPLVSGAERFGHMRAMVRDAPGLFVRAAQEVGPVARLQAGPLSVWLVAEPELVREVMLGKREVFSKNTRGFRKLRPLLGDGLLTSEGEFWKRQRRIAQPVFRPRRVRHFAPMMVKAAEAMVGRWEREGWVDSGRPVEVSEEMTRLTLQIVSETLFGIDVSGSAREVGAMLDALMAASLRRIRLPLDAIERLPLPQNARYEAMIGRLDAIVNGMIERRRRGETAGDDLLSMMLEARDEDGARMSDQQLRDEAMTLFLAGHETTANALSWTLMLLSRHPWAAARLEAEVDAVLGGRAADWDDAERLVWTRQVLEEAMRLYPPAWSFGRLAEEDVALGRYTVPKGTLVMVSAYVLHRRPELWPNPEGFDPERFAPERAPGVNDGTYLPFGGGPRVCIGKHFAMMEMQLVLATLAQRVRLHLVPGHPIEAEPLITLRPRYGLQMTAHRRVAAA